MNSDKLIQMIKVSDYMKHMININNIYNHIFYLQRLTYMYSLDEENKFANIKYIIEDVSRYGYKINNCSEYNDLINCLENIKTRIKIQNDNYIKDKVNEEIAEKIIRSAFNI